MSIVKNIPNFLKHAKKSFTTVQNSTIESIKDPASLGIYVYLASKPEDWQISETNLQNHFEKGRDFIRERLSYLKNIGLLKSVPIKNKKGVIELWETVLYTEPYLPKKSPHEPPIHITENPGTWEIQAPGKTRHLEKPPTTNKRSKQIKDNNNHTHKREDLEGYLFFEKPQLQRQSILLRRQCESSSTCLEAYDRLPQDYKTENSFKDVLDSCVIHYGTQEPPQLVSTSRLNAWIKRQYKYLEDQQQKDPPKGNGSDAMSRVIKKHQGGNTYDQHGRVYDPFRR